MVFYFCSSKLDDLDWFGCSSNHYLVWTPTIILHGFTCIGCSQLRLPAFHGRRMRQDRAHARCDHLGGLGQTWWSMIQRWLWEEIDCLFANPCGWTKRKTVKGKMKLAEENHAFALYWQAYSITTCHQILQVHINWSSSKFNISEQQHSNGCPAELPHGWPGKRKLIGQPT